MRWVIGPSLSILAVFLIIFVACLFYSRVIPYFTPFGGWGFYYHVALMIYVLGSILFNMASCMWFDPGSPLPLRKYGEELNVFAREAAENQTVSGKIYRMSLEPGVYFAYCAACKSVKLPRTHHCSVLNKCVLSFDHYCPFVCNAVGHNNYHYFLCFLVHLWLGCVYAFVTTIAMMRATSDSLLMLDTNFGLQALAASSYLDDNELALFIIVAVTISVILSVGFLLGSHIFLVLTNQTTVEYFSNALDKRDAEDEGRLWRNPFHKGWRKNIRRVFGDRGCLKRILWPTVWSPPHRDWEADLIGKSSVYEELV